MMELEWLRNSYVSFSINVFICVLHHWLFVSKFDGTKFNPLILTGPKGSFAKVSHQRDVQQLSNKRIELPHYRSEVRLRF